MEDAASLLDSLLGSKTLLQTRSDVVLDKKVTLSNGKRITLREKSDKSKKREQDAISLMEGDKNGVNELVNMSGLLEKIRIDEITQVELSKFDENNALLEKSRRELEELTRNNNIKNGKKVVNPNTLWTEKYRPKKFIDLIGNEKINAQILKWLNDWNYVVHGGKLIDSNSYNRDISIDPLKRPRKKVILIHGPPGIGKTTIAQCVCRQLGYEMQEINSSDERSGSAVRDKIKNSLKMNSLSGKNICLLLDEIDGAIGNENGFIRVLVNLLNKDIRVTEEWNSFNKLKYNKKEDFIKRPIIAMCNDISAHCLDQLKPYCEIVSFKKSSKNSIKKRLKKIVESEKIGELNESLLDDLIISLDGDIRNCINFLQFQSKSLDGKLKDMEINWFKILKDIYNIDNLNITNEKSKDMIFKELMKKLSNASGELNRINNGCFNLMLQMNNQDDVTDDIIKLKKIDSISEWNYFQDRINGDFKLFERDEISVYESITPLKYFSLFTNFSHINKFYDKKEKLDFKSNDNFELKKKVLETVNKLLIEYEFDINKESMIVNEIFMLNDILIPRNMTAREFELNKVKVSRVIQIMEGLGIEIDSGNANNGAKNARFKTSYVTYSRMRPNIVLGMIGGVIEDGESRDSAEGNESTDSGKNVHELKAMPYVKVIADEIAKREAVKAKNRKRNREREEDEEEGDKDTRKMSRAEPEDSKVAAGAAGAAGSVSTVDFFKKQYTSFHSQLHKGGSGASGSSGDGDVSISGGDGNGNGNGNGKGVMHMNENRIWIKYHEGFSNAVRKEITWEGLFK